ncbi:hypothetical protein [Pontivivens insulae]|uniref:Uncharacterized protein n=1 Tax=Pontivivens insulae TaxID=1639689 RepID=A0A2R8AAP5_9RHOB|nr:hypothetical protein [Pontivivens insulae]RED13189.1 hypothetical protein DFR53_2325 [Pontivivens insulae]SPF29281.1 hypothetical protein POI8812_01589 [Pontivivens insulae]
MARDPAQIDAELHALHGGPDAARLSALHEEALPHMPTMQEQRFQLTHAWIYALVHGDEARICKLEQQLTDLGGL